MNILEKDILYDETVQIHDIKKSNLRIGITTGLLLVLLVLATFLIYEKSIYTSKGKQIIEYTIEASQLEDGLTNNLETLNFKYAEERLNTIFKPNDIYTFTYGLWGYELYLNNELISDSTQPIVMKSEDNLYIKETQSESALPQAIIDKGRLTRGDQSDSIAMHVSITDRDCNINETRQGLVRTYVIEPVNPKVNEPFTLELSKQIQQRLKFASDKIIITIK